MNQECGRTLLHAHSLSELSQCPNAVGQRMCMYNSLHRLPCQKCAPMASRIAYGGNARRKKHRIIIHLQSSNSSSQYGSIVELVLYQCDQADTERSSSDSDMAVGRTARMGPAESVRKGSLHISFQIMPTTSLHRQSGQCVTNQDTV